MDKSPQEQISDREKEIAELKKRQEELERETKFQEFPKWIPDITDPTGQRGFTVENAEQEKKARAGQLVAPQSADQKLRSEEIRRKAKEDEDAALALRDEADEVTRSRQKAVDKPAATDEVKGVAEGTVAEAEALIAKATTEKELKAIEKAEGKRDGGPRVGVTNAIEHRRSELVNE